MGTLDDSDTKIPRALLRKDFTNTHLFIAHPPASHAHSLTRILSVCVSAFVSLCLRLYLCRRLSFCLCLCLCPSQVSLGQRRKGGIESWSLRSASSRGRIDFTAVGLGAAVNWRRRHRRQHGHRRGEWVISGIRVGRWGGRWSALSGWDRGLWTGASSVLA